MAKIVNNSISARVARSNAAAAAEFGDEWNIAEKEHKPGGRKKKR